MDLNDYRTPNRPDRRPSCSSLFAQRMETAAGIADYKKEHDLPVLDSRPGAAEAAGHRGRRAPRPLQEYAVSLYSLLFELSRGYQNRVLGSHAPT